VFVVGDNPIGSTSTHVSEEADMDTGLLIRWGSVIPGREEQALALFDETITYFGSLIEAGKVTSFEPFLYGTSDFETEQGFFIVKGPVASIFETIDSDAYKSLMAKASLLLHHLTVSLLTVGDGVVGQLDRFNKARAELHV
jgi:hypothetical protein